MKKLSKETRAHLYLILGTAAIVILVIVGLYVYFSGAILPGSKFSVNWFIRKVIYVVIGAAIALSAWFVREGYNYLLRH